MNNYKKLLNYEKLIKENKNLLEPNIINLINKTKKFFELNDKILNNRINIINKSNKTEIVNKCLDLKNESLKNIMFYTLKK